MISNTQLVRLPMSQNAKGKVRLKKYAKLLDSLGKR